MRERRNAYRILLGKPEVTRPLGRPRRERIILKFILGITDAMIWTGFICLRIGIS
jgi:hypothetical protein